MPDNAPLYFYTMADYMQTAKRVRVTDDGIITEINGETVEATPIEDYGDYLLSDSPCDDPFFRWQALSGGVFVTSDGYRFTYDETTGFWSDGDMMFGADQDLHPVDDEGNRLEGGIE